MLLGARMYILATIYSLHLLVLPKIQYSYANAEYKRLTLRKDLSHVGVSTINPLYVLTDLQGNNSAACALDCLIFAPECAALLYNASLKSCKLLRYHLSDGLADVSAVENDWEYWEINEACEEDWSPFDGHCYFFAESNMTWRNAVNFCIDHGSYLIELNSPLESKWVTDSYLQHINDDEVQCPNPWSCSCWIGASFSAASGTFVWNYSGMDMQFPEWSPGQPNNITENQDCISLGRDGKANDQHCGILFQFVCEKNESNGLI